MLRYWCWFGDYVSSAFSRNLRGDGKPHTKVCKSARCGAYSELEEVFVELRKAESSNLGDHFLSPTLPHPNEAPGREDHGVNEHHQRGCQHHLPPGGVSPTGRCDGDEKRRHRL